MISFAPPPLLSSPPVIPFLRADFSSSKPKAQGKPFFLFIFAFNVAAFFCCLRLQRASLFCCPGSRVERQKKVRREESGAKGKRYVTLKLKLSLHIPLNLVVAFFFPAFASLFAFVSMVTVVKSAMIVIKSLQHFRIIFYSS